jgi:hypothetical protein
MPDSETKKPFRQISRTTGWGSEHMAFVTRFRVEDLRGRTLADDFTDEAEAVELADEQDAYVVEYRRPGFDLPRPQIIHLQAAE